AAEVSANKKIGLLATNATVANPYCKKLIQDFASGCEIFSRGDPDLVSFIERDFFISSQEQKIAAVKPSVEYFKSCGCDTVILGCTHFTHIAGLYSKVCGEGINVVDSREGVANQALRKLGEGEHIRLPLERDMSFFVTAATESQTTEYRILCSNLNIPWGGIVD
ncbi:MAG: aspartate/glutamate racemase family protein, partial [Treponema sp.]|nr:aspartate/glutamate racemase family protein [Treponema sp.]